MRLLMGQHILNTIYILYSRSPCWRCLLFKVSASSPLLPTEKCLIVEVFLTFTADLIQIVTKINWLYSRSASFAVNAFCRKNMHFNNALSHKPAANHHHLESETTR